MSDNDTTSDRKSDHVRIVLDQDVAAKGVYTGFAAYRLPHEAVPELDLAEIDLTTNFLGKRLRAPLLISSMTGGAHDVVVARLGRRGHQPTARPMRPRWVSRNALAYFKP